MEFGASFIIAPYLLVAGRFQKKLVGIDRLLGPGGFQKKSVGKLDRFVVGAFLAGAGGVHSTANMGRFSVKPAG